MDAANKSNYVQIEKYVYDSSRPLGKGACGTVYLGFYAKGEGNEKTFLAIKEIPAKALIEITDSLLQEINVLRKLKHKNIVAFIDAKKTDDFMYLVTEYCNQGTIEDLITSHNLSEEDVLSYFRQIADAFKYIRQNKILHRDIKPQNLLLHDGQVKVADFGLAKVIDNAQHSKFQTFRGTPIFMAPQIIKQESYSSLSDIWSLGVTLYFMLFRSYPWEEVNPLKLLKKIEQKVNGNLIPEGAIISNQTRDLLSRMLVIDEDKRITWDEFFDHKAIKINANSFSYQSNDVEDLTAHNFLLKSTITSLSDEQNKEIQEYGRRQTMVYENLQEQFKRARRALDYLEFEWQCGYFFLQVAKELESQKNQNPDIQDDLYIKCMFLLYKRSYAAFWNLNQMLVFNVHTSAIIEINKEDFDSLLKSQAEQITSDFNELRKKILKHYEIVKKEFSKWKDILYDAQYSLSKFQLIDRADAYKDNIIEENRNLIMAFNDNFLQLFLLLSKELEPIYEQILESQKKMSNTSIFQEKKIDLIFVYDLIIILTFRNVMKPPPPESNQPLINMLKYYDDRKRIDEIELLHRIHKQREAWLKL